MRVAIACDSQSRTDRLFGVLAARGVEVRLAAPGERPASRRRRHDRRRARRRTGFASPRDGVAVVTAADIFGQRTHHAPRERRSARRTRCSAASADFSQLAPGDYLVHQSHGVGRYHGLKKLAVGTVSILADDRGRRADARSCTRSTRSSSSTTAARCTCRCTGSARSSATSAPRATRRSSTSSAASTWEATRSKVARHVRALAEELLQLYAQRASLPGHRFPPADDSFRELEATFPFDETPDQAAAIDAVLADMEAPRAMDRLVCGDVGYGKTEVALRAIFRAVQGGKQACVLAPTTVLVEQHFRTMTERFARLPGATSASCRGSRARASRSRRSSKLAEGKLDVVVGTHRLLSADVRFKDLGLLVIDEEQRFGVAHKERIKKTRTQVDVLTLTATPIPRTLHLAMAGLRDLSIIATPPADRRAVRTFVSRVDDATIKRGDRARARRAAVRCSSSRRRSARWAHASPDHRLPNDDAPAATEPSRATTTARSTSGPSTCRALVPDGARSASATAR